MANRKILEYYVQDVPLNKEGNSKNESDTTSNGIGPYDNYSFIENITMKISAINHCKY